MNHFVVRIVCACVAAGVGLTLPALPSAAHSVTPSTARTNSNLGGVGLFASDLDRQPIGQVKTGSQPGYFSGVQNGSRLTVVKAGPGSKAHVLAVNTAGGGAAYVYRQYARRDYNAHALQFAVKLGSDYRLPSSGYMVIAQVNATPSASNGSTHVSVILAGSSNRVQVVYTTSTGAARTIWTNDDLSRNAWHEITLTEKVGAGTGWLSLTIDGFNQIAVSTDLGAEPVSGFALGMAFAPSDSHISGHLYINGVHTSCWMDAEINFDDQRTGQPKLGNSPFSFTGVSGAHNMTVQASGAESTPNDLSISVAGGGSSYVYKRFPGSGYVSETVQFSIQPGKQFQLPNSTYMVLAQVVEGYPGSTSADRLDLILNGGDHHLFLEYFGDGGVSHTINTTATLNSGAWNTIYLVETTGNGTGGLTLYVNGASVLSASELYLGNRPINYVAIGNEFSPTNSGIKGHLLIDDVLLSSSTYFDDGFDQDHAGAFHTGSANDEFEGAVGSSRLAIESESSFTSPNALRITLDGGGSAFVFHRYTGGPHPTHRLTFEIQFGSDMNIASNANMVLAETAPDGPSPGARGRVDLMFSPSNRELYLRYGDSSGGLHSLTSSSPVSSGSWTSVEIDETVGNGTGSLSLAVNGKQVSAVHNIDAGSHPIGYFGVGLVSSSHDGATRGHLLIDNVGTL